MFFLRPGLHIREKKFVILFWVSFTENILVKIGSELQIYFNTSDCEWKNIGATLFQGRYSDVIAITEKLTGISDYHNATTMP